jgi:hypothetical protein
MENGGQQQKILRSSWENKKVRERLNKIVESGLASGHYSS